MMIWYHLNLFSAIFNRWHCKNLVFGNLRLRHDCNVVETVVTSKPKFYFYFMTGTKKVPKEFFGEKNGTSFVHTNRYFERTVDMIYLNYNSNDSSSKSKKDLFDAT
jgi:hypothetical protein